MSRIKRGLRNFGYRTVGTMITQGIGFIGFIYLARFLGPEYYGIYVTVGAFVGIFQLFTFKGLRKVVIRRCSKDLESAEKVLNETVGLQSLFVFISIIAMLFASLFTGYDTATKLYIAIFSLRLFSNSFRGYINTIYKFNERMEYISIFDVVRQGLFVGFAILFLWMGYGLFAVVMISVITAAISLLLRYHHSKRIVEFDIFSRLTIDKDVLKPAIDFSGISIVSNLHGRADLFMISLLGTSPEVAIYGVAYNLAREANVLKNLMGDAFFPVAVKTLHEGTVRKKTVIKYSLLFAVGMVGLAVLGYYLAEPVVIFFFGEEYSGSVPILKVLIFYMVAYFSTLPFSEAIQATGNEKVLLFGKGVMAGINIPLNIILYWRYGLIGIAYSTLIIYTIGSLIINLYSYHILDKQGYFR